MSLSARVPSTIKTNKFIPALFSKQVAEAVHSNLVCANLFNTSYHSELIKGDTLYIPLTNTVTATEVVVGTPSAAVNAHNTSAVTLTVDQWYDVKYPIDDMSARQSHIDPFAVARREIAYALAKKIDTSVNTLFSTLNGSTVLGADGSKITDDVLIQAWETLMEADVPPENISLIVDPSAVADFYKDDKMVSSMYGATPSPVTNGFKGFHKVYGIPVYMTNNLTAASTGAYAVMAHKDAIGVVIQEEVEMELYDVPTEHQQYVLGTALWGVIEVRDTFGVPIYTRLA